MSAEDYAPAGESLMVPNYQYDNDIRMVGSLELLPSCVRTETETEKAILLKSEVFEVEFWAPKSVLKQIGDDIFMISKYFRDIYGKNLQDAIHTKFGDDKEEYERLHTKYFKFLRKD